MKEKKYIMERSRERHKCNAMNRIVQALYVELSSLDILDTWSSSAILTDTLTEKNQEISTHVAVTNLSLRVE